MRVETCGAQTGGWKPEQLTIFYEEATGLILPLSDFTLHAWHLLATTKSYSRHLTIRTKPELLNRSCLNPLLLKSPIENRPREIPDTTVPATGCSQYRHPQPATESQIFSSTSHETFQLTAQVYTYNMLLNALAKAGNWASAELLWLQNPAMGA